MSPEDVLREFRIEFVTHGRNVKKGNINVPCPFCGDDPSEHMGISLTNGYWSCWRNRAHRGRNLATLITKLARVPFAEAYETIYGGQAPTPEVDMAVISSESFWSGGAKPTMVEIDGALQFPEEFRCLRRRKLGAERFAGYLRRRGFDRPYEVADYYGLHFARTGEYAHRLIIPYYYKESLQTWSGRSIARGARLRYMALSAENSRLTTKELPYNYDHAAEGGQVLALVEGPFDAMKVDWYGRRQGLRAVAVNSLSIEEGQMPFINTLLRRFSHLIILLDAGTESAALKLKQEIRPALIGLRRSVEVIHLERGDPGDMTKEQVKALARRLEY